MKNKLVALRTSLSVTEKSSAIKKIIAGLQVENTALSDYYIQSSVGSLLEYISTEVDALLADS
jgi:hypothetical protein